MLYFHDPLGLSSWSLEPKTSTRESKTSESLEAISAAPVGPIRFPIGGGYNHKEVCCYPKRTP